jgi:hypothetical protein
MRGNEWDLRVGIELPGRGLTLEDVDFGVLGREEVVIAWLTADAACRIGHLRGRHLGIDLGVRLCLSPQDVSVTVRLVCIGQWVLKPCNRSLREDIGRLAICCTASIHDTVRSRNLCRNRSTCRSTIGPSSSGITATHGIPSARHDGCSWVGDDEENDSVKWLPGMYPATNLRVERSVPITRNLTLTSWIPNGRSVVCQSLVPMRIELLGLECLVVVLVGKGVVTTERAWSIWEMDV